jgi:stalled ribosome rescue protein Dom34
MRIIKKFINDKTKEGTVQLQAEQDEDMYSLYNLILAGDLVEASTIRNVIIAILFPFSPSYAWT